MVLQKRLTNILGTRQGGRPLNGMFTTNLRHRGPWTIVYAYDSAPFDGRGVTVGRTLLRQDLFVLRIPSFLYIVQGPFVLQLLFR